MAYARLPVARVEFESISDLPGELRVHTPECVFVTDKYRGDFGVLL